LFPNNVAVITGGASGIGFAAAKRIRRTKATTWRCAGDHRADIRWCTNETASEHLTNGTATAVQ
jgi:NAD(P)-dependent dehydrogenase (short-subunit alcohol dehydrogenase family)